MADPLSTIETAMDTGLDNSDAAFTQYSGANPGAILSWELAQITVSPDGSLLVAPTNVGCLITAAGYWTFGAPNINRPGYAILLNGVQAAGGSGFKLQIANSGKVYALGSDNATWYVYTGKAWQKTTAPT
jgi:hypothetical protein